MIGDLPFSFCDTVDGAVSILMARSPRVIPFRFNSASPVVFFPNIRLLNSFPVPFQFAILFKNLGGIVMDVQITRSALRLLKQIRKGNIQWTDKTIRAHNTHLRELLKAGFIVITNRAPNGGFTASSSVVITTSGVVYIEQSRARNAISFREWLTLVIAVLAFLLSMFSVLEQAGVTRWLSKTTIP